MSIYLRDRMATSVYHLIARHLEPLKRGSFDDIDKYFIDSYLDEFFSKLKWKHDVFDAEYLTKKTKEEGEYEEVAHTLSELLLRKKEVNGALWNNREYVLTEMNLKKWDVVRNMRRRYYEQKCSSETKGG